MNRDGKPLSKEQKDNFLRHRWGDIVTLDSELDKLGVTLNTLYGKTMFSKLPKKTRNLLFTRRLINWDEIQFFLNECDAGHLEMLRQLINFSTDEKYPNYIRRRLHERYTKVRSEFERFLIHDENIHIK